MIVKGRRVSKNIEDTRKKIKVTRNIDYDTLNNKKLRDKTPLKDKKLNTIDQIFNTDKVMTSNKIKNLKDTKEPQHLIPPSKRK